MDYNNGTSSSNDIMVDNEFYNGTTLYSSHRFLGAADNALDYTVFAVVILTLALILVIEVGRHKLDEWASGNQFFKTVLELMYRELTTLGMVECVIYLLHKYWADFDLAYEVVFIDIHFMLFYTAVINAVQSSFVRVLTTRLTNKQWTMTEDIDIYHYVAIRKEFDKLEEQFQLDKSIPASVHDSISGNGFFPENQNYFRSALDDIAFRIRHPYLSARKKALIVPVRFHELRAHFIESNNLPQKFKVSPYLNLSLTSVLLEFVHISPAAWILLMASANILYFLSGAILDATGYGGSVETFMITVFFAVATLFAVLQFLITLKMKSIFSHIINTKSWTSRATIDVGIDESMAREQLNLFWGGAPHYIIVATQYCQFGYAIGLAVIAVYNQTLSKGGWVTSMLLVWVASYSVFLFLVNRMMPWYTLCTSMGQLVNKDRLHQTLAKVKLKEELRKKEAIQEEMKAKEEMERRKKEEMERLKKEEEAKARRLQGSKEAKPAPPKITLLGMTDSLVTNVGSVFKRPPASVEERRRLRKGRQKSISDGVQFMKDINHAVHEADPIRSFSGKSSPRLSAVAAEKLISVDEMQAFELPPVHEEVAAKNNPHQPSNGMLTSQQTIEQRRKERRRLRKSQSENVAMMRAMTIDSSFALDTSTSPQRRSLANKSTSLTHVAIGAQKDIQQKMSEPLNPIKSEEGANRRNNDESQMSESKFTLPPPTVLSTSTDDFMIIPHRRSPFENTDAEKLTETTNAPGLRDRKQERRRRRDMMKSQSEGVAFMRSSLPAGVNTETTSLAPVCELGEDAQLETLSGLAKLSAKDLPEIPPFNGKRRRSRLRSTSDGVAAMAMGLVRDAGSSKKQLPTEDSQSAKQSSGLTMLMSTEKDLPKGSNPDLLPDEDQTKPSNRVTFAMFQSSSASKALSSPTDRMSSIDSNASVDGDSDIDDVPDALPEDAPLTPKKHIFARSRIDLTSFFQSSKYPAASFLCGPMVCLFMIGRVEVFNIESGILIDRRNTFHILLPDSFIVECTWYCLMMLEMCFVFTYFTRQACLNERTSYPAMKSITAAGWGFMINVLCLLLLLIAESQRCCYPSSTDGQAYGDRGRELGAAEPTYTDGPFYPLDATNECTCSKFGSRLYGGLGSIEPFTFLIIFSPLRFLIASYTLRMFGCRRNKHEQVLHASDHNHGSHDFDLMTKARELWLSTVGIHSDVAMKFGMFSGQFLQCMLGIYSQDQSGEYTEEPYANVKELGTSQPSIETSIQSNEDKEIPSLFLSDTPSPHQSHPHKRRDAFNFEAFGFVFDDFSYPTSRLIRRMRRCERRLLPFLDEWQVADAVLTSHELVLFDAHEENEYNISDPEIDLTANGGKGLRLCDVARGRKILSQFDLDDIDFVDIEHRLATVSDSMNDVESGHEQLLEFWQGGNDNIDSYSFHKMDERWCNVNEDRLKIHFKSGGGTTLFMRFTVDLKEMERRKIEFHAGNELSDVGRQAKVWCRSIAHLRGATNLTKQDLPNFNDDQEMDDFIELCPREEEIQEGKLKTLLRRNKSFVFDDLFLGEVNNSAKKTGMRNPLRKSISIDAQSEENLDDSSKKVSRKQMKRSQSMSHFPAAAMKGDRDALKFRSKDDSSLSVKVSATDVTGGTKDQDTRDQTKNEVKKDVTPPLHVQEDGYNSFLDFVSGATDSPTVRKQGSNSPSKTSSTHHQVI